MRNNGLRLARSLPLFAALGLLACGAPPPSDEASTSTASEALSSDTSTWAQDGYGPSKARATSQETAISSATVSGLSQSWAGGTFGWTTAAAKSGGRVVVGSDNGKVNAFDATTGARLWTRTLPGSVSATPAMAYGRVYVTSGDMNLYVLSASSGGIIYKVAHPGQVSHSAPLVADNTVYVRCEDDGVVYAYDAKAVGTVTPIATYFAGAGSGASADPSFADSTLYVPGQDGVIHAFSTLCAGACSSGWLSEAAGGVSYFPIAVTGNALYATVISDTTIAEVAFDRSSGARLWSKTLDGIDATGPALAYGRVFVPVAGPNELWALSATTGALIWKGALGGSPSDNPSVANHLVFAPSSGAVGHLDAFDTSCATGGGSCTPVWSAAGLPPYVTAPSIGGGSVLVGASMAIYSFVLP